MVISLILRQHQGGRTFAEGMITLESYLGRTIYGGMVAEVYHQGGGLRRLTMRREGDGKKKQQWIRVEPAERK